MPNSGIVKGEKSLANAENLAKSRTQCENFIEAGEPSSKLYNLQNVMFERVPPEGHPANGGRMLNGEEIKIEEQQMYCYQQWEPNLINPAGKQQQIFFRNEKKYHQTQQLHQQQQQQQQAAPQRRQKNYDEELADSSRSEEDAATTIQAVYRGYKARRRFNEIRKTSSEEQQKAKRVAELLAMPVAKNLHKPLEPIKVSSSFACQEKNSKDHKQSCLSPRKKKRDSLIVRNTILAEENERNSSQKDLEGLRFDAISPQPTPRNGKKSRQTNLQAVKSTTNLVEVMKPIETIKSPSFFNPGDERLSSITPSENTDTDDPFSPRIDERSNIDLQTTRESLRQNIAYNEDLRRMGSNENRPKTKTRGMNMQQHVSGIHRQLPQRMNTSLVVPQVKNYYQQNSLFYPDREAVLIFGGIDPHEEYGCTGNTGKDMYRFKPSENSWEFVGEIPEPRHHHSVVYLKGKVYLVGGADPREDEDNQQKSTVVSTVWSYDPASRIWFNEPGMSTARKNFSLVVSHGKMFAIGGQDRNGIALKSVEAFDPTDCVWREMRPMFIARVGPASAKYQNRIWVAGGMTKSKKEPLSREVECYDPLENLWLKSTPLRSPRCFASMYVISEVLYLIGGAGNNTSKGDNVTESMDVIDVWDRSGCAWHREAEMAIARHGHSTSSIGGQLLIIGGVTTIYMGTLKSVECYCSERGNWIKGVSSLPYSISGHGSVSLPPVNILLDP